MPGITIAILAAAAYLVAMTLLIIRLVRRTASPLAPDTMRGTALFLGLGGGLLHLLSLWGQVVTPEGLSLGLPNIVSLIGWVVTVVILLSALRQRVLNLSIPLLPLGAFCAVLGALPLDGLPTLVDSPSAILVSHIFLSIASYSLLSVAAVLALVLSFQESRLRGRHPGGVLRILPPLEITERLLFQLILIGFVGLTLALFTGLLFVDNLLAQHLAHKTILSTAAWLLFGILLWGRYQFGWRGRIAIRWTLSAFVLLALAYFGSRIVLELVLGQRWG
ncbi:cytochrome c biogenesis protein CcsA [Gammaproteobacteria bacterium AB-CW1]|uniref:Cytochrome c biogenesis protein CcsA n=1 Tax=Natronospira elongata TaxID=3110268 RepID=A0AAP6JD32_9GAMM|nr:cytochrome c biogenesis protein CcsA [Gammaproteobacteria bacterium AB-CW1]